MVFVSLFQIVLLFYIIGLYSVNTYIVRHVYTSYTMHYTTLYIYIHDCIVVMLYTIYITKHTYIYKHSLLIRAAGQDRERGEGVSPEGWGLFLMYPSQLLEPTPDFYIPRRYLIGIFLLSSY